MSEKIVHVKRNSAESIFLKICVSFRSFYKLTNVFSACLEYFMIFFFASKNNIFNIYVNFVIMILFERSCLLLLFKLNSFAPWFRAHTLSPWCETQLLAFVLHADTPILDSYFQLADSESSVISTVTQVNIFVLTMWKLSNKNFN